MTVFSVQHTARHSRARTGLLCTGHGDIPTPNFMPVATRGVFHGMELTDAADCGADVLMCNTLYLSRQPGAGEIAKAGGLHRWMNWPRALATDSGGFQVFSLGAGLTHGIGKQAGGINARPYQTNALVETKATIDPGGVIFSDGAELVRLTPAIATHIQEQLGADIVFAFDECTSPRHDEKYNTEALARTHQWARQCLEARNRQNQLMFGIVQGGTFESLRKRSAKIIGAMPFDGVGIGGSFGEQAMAATLEWIMPWLPEAKPRHLLGIGWIQDILLAVDQGVDLFDCVEPIRRARHGHVLTTTHYLDVVQIARRQNDGPLLTGCDCLSCRTNSADQIKKWFKSGNFQGSRAISIHNTRVMIRLMEEIRSAITEQRWQSYKQERLAEIEQVKPTVTYP